LGPLAGRGVAQGWRAPQTAARGACSHCPWPASAKGTPLSKSPASSLRTTRSMAPVCGRGMPDGTDLSERGQMYVSLTKKKLSTTTGQASGGPQSVWRGGGPCTGKKARPAARLFPACPGVPFLGLDFCLHDCTLVETLPYKNSSPERLLHIHLLKQKNRAKLLPCAHAWHPPLAPAEGSVHKRDKRAAAGWVGLEARTVPRLRRARGQNQVDSLDATGLETGGGAWSRGRCGGRAVSGAPRFCGQERVPAGLLCARPRLRLCRQAGAGSVAAVQSSRGPLREQRPALTTQTSMSSALGAPAITSASPR
jgi:hypothetical protein